MTPSQVPIIFINFFSYRARGSEGSHSPMIVAKTEVNGFPSSFASCPRLCLIKRMRRVSQKFAKMSVVA